MKKIEQVENCNGALTNQNHDTLAEPESGHGSTKAEKNSETATISGTKTIAKNLEEETNKNTNQEDITEDRDSENQPIGPIELIQQTQKAKLT